MVIYVTCDDGFVAKTLITQTLINLVVYMFLIFFKFFKFLLTTGGVCTDLAFRSDEG